MTGREILVCALVGAPFYLVLGDVSGETSVSQIAFLVMYTVLSTLAKGIIEGPYE